MCGEPCPPNDASRQGTLHVCASSLTFHRLQKYAAFFEEEAEAKKAIKEEEKELEQKVLAKYPARRTSAPWWRLPGHQRGHRANIRALSGERKLF